MCVCVCVCESVCECEGGREGGTYLCLSSSLCCRYSRSSSFCRSLATLTSCLAVRRDWTFALKWPSTRGEREGERGWVVTTKPDHGVYYLSCNIHEE